MTKTMADPDRIRPADPVCAGCGRQAKTVALVKGRGFLCATCACTREGNA